MSTVNYSKGTLTLFKRNNGLTKEEVFEKAKKLFQSFIVSEEVGVSTESDEDVHYHVAYMNPRKVPNELVREEFGQVYISEHRETQSKQAAAAYTVKEDKKPLIWNWDDWKSDIAKGRYNKGEGTKREKARLAWQGDVEGMKEMGMPPSEVNREVQSLAPVEEAKKTKEYVNFDKMELEFKDYRTNKVATFEVTFPGQLLKTRRGEKEIQFKGRRGIWLYGPSRCGKTYQTRELIKKYNGYECSDTTNWSGYSGQQLIFINDVRSGMFTDPSEMRSFLDSTSKNRKYGNKLTDPDNTFYVFTCNYSVREFWNACLGESAKRYMNWIEPLLNVLIEIQLRGHYMEEGVITYGTARFNLADSDSEQSGDEEVTRKKRLRETEEDRCTKRMKYGDPTIRKNEEDGCYIERIQYDATHYVERKLVGAEWQVIARGNDNQQL